MSTIIAPFFNTDNATDGFAGADYMLFASDVAAATMDGNTYVYVASQGDSAVQVLSMNSEGILSSVGAFFSSGSTVITPVTSLEIIRSASEAYLLVKGYYEYTVFEIDALTGLGTLVENVADTGTSYFSGFEGSATAEIGGIDYVFLAGQNENAITSFALDPASGALTSIDIVLDSDSAGLRLSNVWNLHTAQVSGTTFLFASSVDEDGVSVFSVAPDGTLTNRDNVGDTANLQLDGASGIATAVVNASTYLFVAGSDDSGISTFSVSATGTLTNVANYKAGINNPFTGLNKPWEITAVTYDGATFLIVSNSDDGNNAVALSVEDDGSLTEIARITDNGTLNLANTRHSYFLEVNGKPFLFVTGFNDNGISVFEMGGQDDVLEGTSGDDDMFGFAEDDVLGGRGGSDRLYGGTGNDILDGAGGTDTLRGGAGADTLIGGAGLDAIDYAGSGSAVTVNLQTGAASGGAAAGDVFFGIENLVGSAFADDLTGDGGANRINGAGGNDRISGVNGNDSLNGAGGSDSILGGAGLDSISGGAGKDTIDGGADTDLIDGGVRRDILAGGTGDDTMTGGGGRDDFVFVNGDGADVITDFLVGTDRIDLRGHVGATDFTSLIRFNVPGQGVLVQIDADDSIFILGVTNAQLLASDFLF